MSPFCEGLWVLHFTLEWAVLSDQLVTLKRTLMLLEQSLLSPVIVAAFFSKMGLLLSKPQVEMQGFCLSFPKVSDRKMLPSLRLKAFHYAYPTLKTLLKTDKISSLMCVHLSILLKTVSLMDVSCTLLPLSNIRVRPKPEWKRLSNPQCHLEPAPFLGLLV